jgi:ketosteroid isomerase-like protein
MSSPWLVPSQFSGPGSFSDIETMIRNMTQDLVMAFNTGNYDHAASLFAADGVFISPYREVAYGNRSIEHRLAEIADAGYHDLRLETTRIEHSNDMAVELGRYRLEIRTADGTLRADTGNYLATWRRLGVWRALAVCWSSSQSASAGRTAA